MTPLLGKLRPALLGILAVGLVGCGGDDNNPAGPGPAAGPMSATINGTPWAASEGHVYASVTPALPGLITISGTSATTTPLAMIFTLYNISGPGTFPLGVGSSVFGGSCAIGEAVGGWGTPLTGDAGTVTITVLTPTRIAGTFSFTATASTGGATGEKVVTDGQFDITWAVTLTPVPENAGSRASATVGGTEVHPVNVVTSESGGNLVIVAGNFEGGFAVNIATFAGAGLYTLSDTAPFRTIQVTEGTATWGLGAGTTGTIDITSVTASRIVGTFTGTLGPVAGTTAVGTVDVTGTFDVGRP